MNGSKYVSFNQIFIQKNSVFVVVAFPRHIRNNYVMTESQLAMVSCRTISQYLFFYNFIAFINNGALVYASTLVGAFEFQQGIGVNFAIFSAYTNLVAYYAFNNTRTFCQYANAGVNSNLVFHTSTNNGSLGAQQRNCLTLHVGAHQCTVRVIVFKEGNECSCNGNYLFRRNVHVIYLAGRNGKYVVFRTCGNTIAQEVAVFIQGFVCLRNDISIFNISGHVTNFVSYTFVFFINAAVRSFHEAIFVDNCKGGQRTNQADVRTFRSFDRTHTTIVRVVYVANFIACAFTAQTAGAQCGQTTFMSQLCQRVVLVHELGQLAAAEEFFNSSNNRTNVDESLRSDNLSILNGHTLFNYSFHTSKANTELVLQKLTYTANTTVAQMVNVIASAMTVHQVQQVVEGSQYVFNGNGTDSFIDTGGEQHVHILIFIFNFKLTQTLFSIYATCFNLV